MKLESVIRPNGKIYRPRKPPVVIGFVDEHRGFDYVAVMRTHNVELATRIAQPYRLAYLIIPEEGPQLSWLRHTMRDDEPWYEYDAVTGAACVVFQESDDPQEVVDAEMNRLAMLTAAQS